MVVLHQHPFRVASYHQKINPRHADSESAAGLVFEVVVEFRDWLGGTPLKAEAFLDPGADYSLISQRWTEERALEHDSSQETPWTDPDGGILEPISISVGNWKVPLGDTKRPVWIFEQDYGPEDTAPLPGYEDLLLGRDFLSQHNLLVLIDGDDRNFSILAPTDDANVSQRSDVLNAMRPRL